MKWLTKFLCRIGFHSHFVDVYLGTQNITPNLLRGTYACSCSHCGYKHTMTKYIAYGKGTNLKNRKEARMYAKFLDRIIYGEEEKIWK